MRRYSEPTIATILFDLSSLFTGIYFFFLMVLLILLQHNYTQIQIIVCHRKTHKYIYN